MGTNILANIIKIKQMSNYSLHIWQIAYKMSCLYREMEFYRVINYENVLNKISDLLIKRNIE